MTTPTNAQGNRMSAEGSRSTAGTRVRTRVGVLALAAVLLAGTSGLGGCENGGQGAMSGAALGALAGLGLGSLSGDMGKGAAAGAIIGGLGGLLVGDQNSRR
jgi:hypothetical protein